MLLRGRVDDVHQYPRLAKTPCPQGGNLRAVFPRLPMSFLLGVARAIGPKPTGRGEPVCHPTLYPICTMAQSVDDGLWRMEVEGL